MEWLQEQEEIKKTNNLKSVIDVGDVCISKTYGVGYVTEIEQNDCWYPLSIRFEQKLWIFGKFETKYKHVVYNTDGQTNSIDDDKSIDGVFYKKILNTYYEH